MSFQAHLDNIHAKTGKTPDDFHALAKDKGLTDRCQGDAADRLVEVGFRPRPWARDGDLGGV